ncbi:MAG: hypothetical protein V4582_10940 [Pseudomonadota bacterium]
MSKQFWTIFCVCMWLVLMGGLEVSSTLADHYAHTRPTVADPATGRTHPYDHWHGRRIYLTDSELVDTYLAEGTMILGFIGFIIGARKRRSKPN